MWWQAGAAALLWGACAGVPTALGVRAWGRRSPRPKRVPAPVPAAPDPMEPEPETGEGATVGGKPSRMPSLKWVRLRDRDRGRARNRFRLLAQRTGAAPGLPGPGADPYGRGPYGRGPYDSDPYDDLYGDPFGDTGYEPYDFLPAAWEPATKPEPQPQPHPQPQPEPEPESKPEPRPEQDSEGPGAA